MFDLIKQDFARYREVSIKADVRLPGLHAVTRYSFFAVALYRYVRWTRRLPRAAGVLLRLPYHVAHVPVELLFGIDISANADIGPGLYIGHHGCIFIHCDAGRNLSVGQGVTVGFKGAGQSTRWPTLGDDVYIGAGAKVVGDIRIGDGVMIGANAVVAQDVPAHARVVGAALRVLHRDAPKAERKRCEHCDAVEP